MPAIWNVGNSNGYNNKKISSKLTFEDGETFKGRIVGKNSEDASVTIRLTDGWQFSAELVGDSDFEGKGLVQFKVEGFEGDKIKLKVINDLKNIDENADEDIVKDFMQKKGMSKEDFSILKAMVKFNLPLTKENIDFVKSIFNFSDKVNTREGIDDFIEKYIAGKGIDFQSEDAAMIKETLTEFFNVFKEMSQDDILLFLENNIDINKENIESYNKLFKSDMNLKEYFDSIYKDFEELNLEKSDFIESGNNDIKEVDPKNIEENAGENQPIRYSQNQNAGLKVYDKSIPSKNRVSLLNLLRTITGNENNLTKDTIKEILIDNKDIFKDFELSNIFNKIDSISEDEINNVFKDFVNKYGMTKEAIKGAIEQLVGKQVELTDSEVFKFKEILNFKTSDGENLKNNNPSLENENVVKQNSEIAKSISENESNNLAKTVLQSQEKLTSSNLVKHEINGKIESIKDVIKQIMSHSEDLKNRSLESKVAEFIKNNLNDFKLFNSISNEYYYLDVPIRRDTADYPCKLIIKDDRKGNKKIDSSNVKMVVAVKTINMGVVDAYLTVAGNNLDVNIKCADNFIKLLSRGKDQLISKLQGLGYFVNISVSEKVDEVNLTSCRQFFDDDNTSTVDIKV